MMKCPEEKDLQRFADGELKGRRSSQVAEHVRNCVPCARELQQLRFMRELVSGAIRKETEGNDFTGFWENVRAGIAKPRPHPTLWEQLRDALWKPAARVAYVTAAVLTAGFFAVTSLGPGGTGSGMIRQARVEGVFSHDPDVTVSVVMASEGESAMVWISGLEATEEN